MTTISLTELYEILSVKFGKEEAKNLVTYIEEKVEKEVDNKTRHLASREDLESGFKEQSRDILKLTILLVVMILGLYAVIFTHLKP